MALNFNVDPYYDDFDDTKNFHRILFKPGKAVQARELTQAQTILQDQITKFANNIFKENSPVTGGQITTNFNCYYIKLQSTYNGATIDVTEFDGLLLTNSIGTIKAKVVAVAQATGTSGEGDPPTLVVVYKSGTRFTDNDIIYDVNSNKTCQAITNGSTGESSVVSIAKGVFYVLGNFVQIEPTTIILSKYDSTPSRRVGLEITETIYDYANDASLLDPAVGASNYQAPGADRYVISLELTSKPLYFGDDQLFIELLRVEDGNVFKMVDGSVYAAIDDYFAKRDYETNGDYIVNDFSITPKVDPDDEDKYIMGVGKGLAYVHGYRVENPSPVNISSNRARTVSSKGNDTTVINYGSYFIVSNVHGANSKTFDVTTANTVDLHCVSTDNVHTANATTYNSTLVSRGYIRGLDYQSAPTANANTHIFKAMVYDLQNQALTGTLVSATPTTIVLPGTNGQTSSFDDAYVGVDISITSGTNAGETRTITGYVGSTRTATVNRSWSVTPDATSNFVMNFNTTDVESMLQINSSNYTVYGKAKIDDTGKENNLSSGDAILVNPNKPELIFPIGLPYVSGVTDASYTSFIEIRGVSFGVAGSTLSATLTLDGSYLGVIKHIGTENTNLSADLVRENFTIIVTNAQSNSKFAAGDIVNWSVSPRTIAMNGDLSVATLQTTTSDLTAFTATIIFKVDVPVATNSGLVLKIKNLIRANANNIITNGTQVNTYTFVDDSVSSNGQIYIQSAGVVAPGTKQSLYLSDVKQVVKIIDTKSSGTLPLVAMYDNSTYNVTNNYIFDNGQRDGYYDHASITLKPGAPKPAGNLLVYVDYYKHSGGDGYFSKTSYLDVSNSPEDYREIQNYTSKNGTTYSLRDCLDFRPARQNAQMDFVFRFSNPSDTRFGSLLPVDATSFICDYEYYLGRKDKLVLTKDRSLQIIEGSPSINPILPNEPDASLTIANITHNPYTGYVTTEAPIGKLPDLSVEKVQHRRYTMADIAGLDTRINRVEYYTSLNSLEQNANSLQISDAYGLNRFKNGIMVDDFSGFSASDSGVTDFNANINRRTRQLTAGQIVKNFPLKNLAMIYNMNSPTTSSISGLNYNVSKDGSVNYFTLPYTTSNIISQKLASRTTNVNPFNTPFAKGGLSLSPNMDTWVDTTYSPALLVVDSGLQVFQRGDVTNTLAFGDWQTIPGTSVTSLESQKSSPWATVSTTTGWTGNRLEETTIQNSTLSSTYVTKFKEQQTNLLGPYNKIDNTYSLNNGYINDISVLPWIRTQQILIKASSLLIKTKLHAFFDNVSVDNYVRRLNTIEVESITGTFKEGDIIGYYSAGTFTPTGKVEGVYNYTDTTKVRLYVSNDFKTTTYNNGLALQNALFNTSGVYQSSTASGSVVATQFGNSSEHYSGTLKDSTSTTSVQLSPLASSTNDFYNGLTLFITSGANPGQSAVITAYNGTTKVVTLATPITVTSVVASPDKETYSIGSSTGSIETNERGDFFGVFTIPANTFHNGQKVFRLDNRINNNEDTVTTYAEGTFYAEGLQVNKQNIDFGASPAGAKDVFTQTRTKDSSYTTTTSSVQTRRNTRTLRVAGGGDPVAQNFQIDPTNFPNGAFLSSIRLFFASKPTSTNDGSPVTLSILGTLNGYPNGTTLDHSVVTLDPTKVKVSQTPQFLDSTTYTEFTFSAPVYIQPGVLYAFMVKSGSNEYTLWTASNNEDALPSTVKNLPTDPYPSSITKISAAHYVGGLFISQNSQTWEADQNQSLMFTVDRCVFNTAVTPSVRMVIPKKLPQRTLVDSEIDFYKNANTMTDLTTITSSSNMLVDAFNISTTDFVPSATSINYNYDATLQNGTSAGQVGVNPGKYGTTMYEHIYLDDNQGERLLIANSETSFSLYSQLSSQDDAVSPVISDAGTSVFTVQYDINNCELSNSLISIVSQGSSYATGNTTVTISAPTGTNPVQAYASPVIEAGKITSIYLTTPGSGYIETPTISIDVSGGSAAGASAIIAGETSKNGGPAATRYVTKKVVLEAGFDSGDLNVYLSAYRPAKTDIQVYYKILNRNDTQGFADGSWILMTKTKNTNTLYSKFRGDLHEYTFAPGTLGTEQGYVSYTSTNGQTYNSFNQFAIKIVLMTTDKTIIPYLTDMRCIALPSNINSVLN
jgi:predicted small secreted protein